MPTVTTPFSVTAPSGAVLQGSIQRPIPVPFRPRPRAAVVLLPGGVGAGRRMARSPGGTRLAEAGMVVVSFNAEGRSSGKLGDRRSGGTLDFNGARDQDGLAVVIRHVLELSDVDPDRLGLCSISFGLVAATGCMARHPDLPVRYLVDEEGPADGYSAMLQGWRLVDLGERPDRAQKALDLFGHACPGEGSPSSASASAFWGERLPLRDIAAFRGRYLRLQAEWDHVQPPQEPAHVPLFRQPPRWWQGRHAMQLVNAAVAAGLPWVRVNLPAQGNAVGATYDPVHPPRWIPGRMADHRDVWVDGVLEMAGMDPS